MENAVAFASVWHWQRRSGARLHSYRFADCLPLSATTARPKRNSKDSPESKACIRHDICYFANSLQVGTRHFMRHGKAALAALLVGMVLFLDAMAACPALHELIHHDADKPDHQCAVTLIAHGKVSAATCEIIIPSPTIVVEAPRHFTIFAFSPAIENLPQGRAPPAVSSPQV